MSKGETVQLFVRATALRRALPFAVMFVGALFLGFAGAAGAFALTGNLLAGIVVLILFWAVLPYCGYKVLSKREAGAERSGPFILLEERFLTYPQNGSPDMGLDLKDAVLCAYVLEVWQRVHTQADGKVIKSRLRQRFAVVQLQQPESGVRFLAELGPRDRIPDLPRLHRSPKMPDGYQMKSLDIWPDDFSEFLSALRSWEMREVEAGI